MFWQKYREGAAFSQLALRCHMPTVTVDDVFDDSEAQAGTAHAGFSSTRSGFIDTIKSFGKSGDPAFWNAGPLIRY